MVDWMPWYLLAGLIFVLLIVVKLKLLAELFRSKYFGWGFRTPRIIGRESFNVWMIVVVLTLALIVGEYVRFLPGMTDTAYYGLALLLLAGLTRINARQQHRAYAFVRILPEPKQLFPIQGIYATVRHPDELALLLAILGITLFFGLRYSLIVAVILLLPATIYRVGAKDRELIGKHGKAYIDYSRNTKKLIPYIY